MATTITISEETKEEFDKQRTLKEGQVSAEDFIKYLLDLNKTPKKR